MQVDTEYRLLVEMRRTVLQRASPREPGSDFHRDFSGRTYAAILPGLAHRSDLFGKALALELVEVPRSVANREECEALGESAIDLGLPFRVEQHGC